MGFLTNVWSAACSTIAWFGLAPGAIPGRFGGVNQIPITYPASPTNAISQYVDKIPIGVLTAGSGVEPPPFKFKPPGGQPEDDFLCDYSKMMEWNFCSHSENRECWLRHPDGRELNIHTDYEKYNPIGIDRFYTLDVSDSSWNADGESFESAKLFNKTYPGPWIQACWGDTIHVNVTNLMKHNGTSIHWHGIRQWLTMNMDGVNGVSQCPIAPQDHFVYKFKALQYGSSWYHSHYSMQYADGLLGPLTIHGPTSASFDLPASEPLLMTDWDHESAFKVDYGAQYSINPSIVLNGRGNVNRYHNKSLNSSEIPDPYTLTFEQRDPTVVGRAKRYLLRVINTSFDTTFVFSIDHHWLQVISTDFVPIEPYYTTSILVGIGQRYHVVVAANPVAYNKGEHLPDEASDLNFWIRTYIAACPKPGPGPSGPDYMKTGVLRYDNQSRAEPTTDPWDPIPTACSDEPYASLIPKLPWTVGSPVNGISGEVFYINFTADLAQSDDYPLASFSLADREPLRINYSDPVFDHLDDFNIPAEHRPWVVIPEEYNSTDWVWLVISGNIGFGNVTAHPIHLHGHDFAILQVEEHTQFSREALRPKRDNPPRRDVVLVPQGGFVVIAFKADNPGSWLIHCHIASHASRGLAMQILERQGDANAIWPKGSPALREADRVCGNWKTWQEDPRNWYPGVTAPWFQDDSGI